LSSPELSSAGDARPLVAVVCSVPLVGEAVRSVLDFAEVRSFGGGQDTAGLLASLLPDAVIVDSDEDADAAMGFARQREVPVLHIRLRDRSLRLFRDGAWEHVAGGEGPTPEAIRNVIAGALFSRRVAMR
jgi:hypothetical protein